MRPEPRDYQPSLFPDVPIDRPSKRKPRKRTDDDPRPTPTFVWHGPRRDSRMAYDRPGDVDA